MNKSEKRNRKSENQNKTRVLGHGATRSSKPSNCKNELSAGLLRVTLILNTTGTQSEVLLSLPISIVISCQPPMEPKAVLREVYDPKEMTTVN